jgi:hypothetical protein
MINTKLKRNQYHPRNNTVYKHGKIDGADRPINYAKWFGLMAAQPGVHDKLMIKTLDDMHHWYKYSTLRRLYPWANRFRAGVIFLHKSYHGQAINFELLLVHEKEIVQQTIDGARIFPMRKGFPKGESECGDMTALRTAQREFLEETNINTSDVRVQAKLATATITIARPEVGITEIMLYFIIVSDSESRPPVKIYEKELSGYEWVSVNSDLYNIQNMTATTKRVMNVINAIDFCRPINCIDLA